ncbi:MAG: hypothetical protein OHK0013_21050 [Sandaracinaceae bacterium]
MRALLAPMLAGVAWLGAHFRELVTESALDPLALLMRLLAIALTTRAALLLVALVRRLRVAARARRSVLVLAPEGLFFTDGVRELARERAGIVGVVEPGVWQTRAAGRRWAEVFVVGASADELVTALPPVFEHSPGILAEKLMRWLGPQPYEADRSFPEPARLASKVYEDAARGIVEPGTLVVRHGHAWARRGPYATVLLAVAVVEGLVRLDASLLADLWPVAAVAVLVAVVVPTGWLILTRREIAVRRGVAFVLTPAELLVRTRSGVHRARWGKLQRVTIDTRRAFSILDGLHVAKTLVLKRKDEPPIRYDEAFLGVPAEVAQVLIDAYRTGALPLRSAADQPAKLVQPTADREPDRTLEDARNTGRRHEADVPREA